MRIRELHMYATRSEDVRALQSPPAPRAAGSAAVVGGGPAGLACAFELAKFGHAVDLYNDGPAGGVPGISIPAYRLPEEDLARDTAFLARYFHVHDVRVDAALYGSIAASHRAIFIGIGLGRDRQLGIPGEHIPGVQPVMKFLRRARRGEHVVHEGSHVVVVGGGNVSLDAAATARRHGAAGVVLLYRRAEGQMRAWTAERAEARRQGVDIRFLTVPVAIEGEEHVSGVRCRATRLGMDLDESGRPLPVEIPGSEFVIPADAVVTAIGQELRAPWLPPLRRTKKGYIEVKRDFQTSRPGIFAGGDAVHGEGTVVSAVADGVAAARAMHAYLMRKRDGA